MDFVWYLFDLPVAYYLMLGAVGVFCFWVVWLRSGVDDGHDYCGGCDYCLAGLGVREVCVECGGDLMVEGGVVRWAKRRERMRCLVYGAIWFVVLAGFGYGIGFVGVGSRPTGWVLYTAENAELEGSRDGAWDELVLRKNRKKLSVDEAKSLIKIGMLNVEEGKVAVYMNYWWEVLDGEYEGMNAEEKRAVFDMALRMFVRENRQDTYIGYSLWRPILKRICGDGLGVEEQGLLFDAVMKEAGENGWGIWKYARGYYLDWGLSDKEKGELFELVLKLRGADGNRLEIVYWFENVVWPMLEDGLYVGRKGRAGRIAKEILRKHEGRVFGADSLIWLKVFPELMKGEMGDEDWDLWFEVLAVRPIVFDGNVVNLFEGETYYNRNVEAMRVWGDVHMAFVRRGFKGDQRSRFFKYAKWSAAWCGKIERAGVWDRVVGLLLEEDGEKADVKLLTELIRKRRAE